MTDFNNKGQNMKEKKSENIEKDGKRTPLISSGQKGQQLSDQVKLFAEEYAKKGITLTQSQYAKRFRVSDRQIRRWLSDSNVQELIKQYNKKKNLFDFDDMENLELQQLHELKKRIDITISERGNWEDPILESLEKKIFSIDGNERKNFLNSIKKILENDEKRHGEWREPNAAYFKQMSQICELIAVDLEKLELAEANLIKTEI